MKRRCPEIVIVGKEPVARELDVTNSCNTLVLYSISGLSSIQENYYFIWLF